MDWVDYREKLGIGFCDKEKFKYFKTKIFNVLNAVSKDIYSECLDIEEYYAFCNITGMPLNHNYDNDCYRRERFEHCLSIIERANSLSEFLAYYVALTNSIKAEKSSANAWIRYSFSNLLCMMLTESHISFDLFEDAGEYFVFQKGAKELDDALVSEPLEWLKDYPIAHKTYVTALKQYSEGIYIRDVADNLRKALEVVASLAGSIFFGGGDSIFKVHRESVPSIGSQREGLFIAPLTNQLGNFFRFVRRNFEKSFGSFSTNQLGKFFGFERKNF